LSVVEPDTSSLHVLDSHTDPFPALSVGQPLIDFEAQSQLMSTSTSSPVDLLLSASDEQGTSVLCFCILIDWWHGTVVERRSLAGELSLSCARHAADG